MALRSDVVKAAGVRSSERRRAWADSSKRASEPDAERAASESTVAHYSPRAHVPLSRRLRPGLKWYLSQSGCGIKSGINTTFLARNCGSVSVAPELTMPPRRTGFNEYMPQGQRTLTEVDGVREAGLEEPGASAANGGGIDMNVDVAEADIDNLNAGGFFARYGREPNGPSPTVIPPHTPGGEP